MVGHCHWPRRIFAERAGSAKWSARVAPEPNFGQFMLYQHLHRVVGYTAGLLAVAISCAGCSGDSAESGDPVLSQMIEARIAAGDVPGEVVAILENASARGVITFEDYVMGAQFYEDCAAELGVAVTRFAVESQGQRRLEFTSLMPSKVEPGSDSEEEHVRYEQQCRSEWLGPLEALYLSQPVATDQLEADFAPFLAPVIECLSRLGIETAHDTYQEIEPLVSQVGQDTGTNCLLEVGYLGR